MNSTAAIRSAAPGVGQPYIDTAVILQRDQGGLLLRTGDGAILRAARAAGCLLEPDIQDSVLVARDTGSGAWVLTVLERGDSPARIGVEGNPPLAIESRELRLGAERIDLEGREYTGIRAAHLEVAAERGKLGFAELAVDAGRAMVRGLRLAVVAETLETAATRIAQRARDSFRNILRLDQTRAGQISTKAEDGYHLEAGDASLLAKGDMKVDGERIRIG